MPKKKYRIYFIELPYPPKNKQKVRMIGMKLDSHHPTQPFFFASDIAKLLHMKQEDVLKLAVPHIDAISNTKVISTRGYAQVCLFGKTKYNKKLQHIVAKWATEELTDIWSKPYLKVLSGGIYHAHKSSNKHERSTKQSK